MKTFSLRSAAVKATIALLLGFHPSVASAVTVTVMVGPNCLCFSPASVTIHPGDTVQWTWSSSGHSTTSGAPGMPNGIWDSGILNQGATFSHTFNSAGSFDYYCTPHGECCGMVGTVDVVNPNQGPTPTPTSTFTPAPTPTFTPAPTATATPASTPIATATSTLTAPPTPTATATATFTPVPSPTARPRPSYSPRPTLPPRPTPPQPTPAPTPAIAADRAVVGDFNGDGHPDWVVHNTGTRQTAIWYLNNNVFIGGAFGPTLVAGWGLRDVADFKRDGHPDYALFAPMTFQTAIWYLSGPRFMSSAYGPTLPSGW